MRYISRIVPFIIAALMLTLLPGGRAHAADERCFPETGLCIGGRFREFWEQNGGLAVFGFPITPAREERNRDTGQIYLTQWFERNRFELHPENAAPYDVLLGRLSDDRLRLMGVDWQAQPRESGPKAGCLWFEQSGHNVCDQLPGIGFRTYWQSHGLRDSKLDAYGRSLALLGLPLTEATTQVSPWDGHVYLIQWFERARFEWHPDEPDEYKMLLGLLGQEVRMNTGGTPTRGQIANSVLSKPIVAGHYLIWHDIRNQPNSDLLDKVVYGYDLNTQTEFQIGDIFVGKRSLASDGVTLAWVQDNLAGPRPHQQIQGYNLDTRTEFTILETADLNTLGSIALDKGILYYSDSTNGHSGMFAHTLATGQERRIHATPIGGDLVVKDGVMLWSDVRFSGEPGPGDGTLHILKLDGSLGDTVIAHGQNGFSGYDLSGDLVAWSAFGSQVYLYHISSGTSEPVSPGPASLASISGRQIGWVSWPDNRPGQPARWLLQLSNLDEGSTRTLDEETGLQTSPFIAVVGPHVVAYTKYDTPGIRTLYVIDLP